MLPPPLNPQSPPSAALPLSFGQHGGPAASVTADHVGVAQPPQHLAQHLVAQGRVGVEQHQLLPCEGAAQPRRLLEVPPGVVVTALQPMDQAALHQALARGSAAAPAQADGGIQVPQSAWTGREAAGERGAARGRGAQPVPRSLPATSPLRRSACARLL